MTICAIHQPNFFPWAGYFDKINKADIFIFLDEVNYPKSGSGAGSWSNRVKFMSSGSPAWLGLPVTRSPGSQLIKDTKFNKKDYHTGKFLKSLDHNYRKFPNYKSIMEFLYPLITYPSNNVSDFNMNAILGISKFLNLNNTQFIRQSELTHGSSSTELLIELTKAVGADTYLCGNGSDGYQNDEMFHRSGITLQYQHYDPLQDKIFAIQDREQGSLSILNHLIKGFGTCHRK